MPKKIKIAVVLLFSIIIALVFTTVTFYNLKEKEKAARLSIEKALSETELAKQAIEDSLNNLEEINRELEANDASQAERIDALSQELDEEKTKNDESLAKIQEKESEIEALKSKIEEGRLEKEELLKRLDKLSGDYLDIKLQLEALAKTKEALKEKVEELAKKDEISLGTVTVKRSPD